MKQFYIFLTGIVFTVFIVNTATAQLTYESCTVTQENLTSVPAGTQNAVIIGIEIETSGSGAAINLTSLKIHTFGTTLLSDISNAKIYYTDTSDQFAPTSQFGSTVATPTDSFIITGSQALLPGTNYFWLTYDISNSAYPANFVDATCTEVKIGTNTYTPTVTNPFGNRHVSKELIFGTGTNADYVNGPTYVRTYGASVYHYEFAIYNYLITSSEISSSALPYGAKITNLCFYKGNSTVISDTGDAVMEIYMKSSNNTSLSSGGWTTLLQGAMKVHQSTWNLNNNFPSSSGWVSFPLDNSFTYSGQALEIFTDYNGSGLGSSNAYNNEVTWAYSSYSSDVAAGRPGYNSKPSSTSTYYGGNSRPNMKLEYVIPPAYDLAVQSFTSPVIQACPGSSELVAVKLKNEGAAPINFASKPVTIDVSVTGPNPTTFPTVTLNSGVLSPGNTQTVTINSNYDMTQLGNYKFTASIDMTDDFNLSNNTKSTYMELSSFPPGGEDFESFTNGSINNFPNGWTSNASDFEWTANKGGTLSASTGPQNDHTYGTGSGTYVYAEASGSIPFNEVSTLTSGCIDMSSQPNKILEFWYFMYGNQMGELYLDVYSNGSWHTGLVSLIGEQQTSQTEPWQRATVDLSSYTGLIQLRFRAIYGSGFRSDIALDDVKFIAMKVDAGPDISSCGGDSVVLTPTISGGVPPYNIFWNPSQGLSDNTTLNPKSAPASTTTYTIYVSDDDGNSDFDNLTVSVLPKPQVSFTGLATDYCEDDGNTGLNPNPVGGYFTGPGTVGYSFNPSLAGPGTHDIVYNYINSQGCLGTDTKTVTVHALPDISFNGLKNDYCLNDPQDTLFISPAGGTLTAPVLNGNIFNPATAGTGTFTLTYTYTDTWGCTNTENFVITVHDIPSVSITNLPADMCENSSPHTLTGNPAGGTFSGTGVSAGSFDPATAGTGTHTITYFYTDTYGCSNSTTEDVTVHPVPSVSFSGLPSTLCENDAAVSLSGNPAGGTFSGPGLSGDSFDPATAGTGNHSITYTYTDAWGCTNSETQSVEVRPLPVVSFSGLANGYCITDSPVTLVGSPPGGTFSGPGISGSQFNPSGAAAGIHTITYNYTDSYGCSNTDNQTTEVEDIPVVSIDPVSTDMCLNDAAVSLTGNPSGGTFTGPGISGSTFDPTSAGTGTHTITYTYVTTYGCTNSSTVDITVHNIPVVSLSGLASDYCEEDTTVSLTANPAGGSFSGQGISGSSFNPSVAGAGNHTITYTYTDTYGCSNTDDATTTVHALPAVSMNVPADACVDETSVSLSGNPSGGTFSGTGVSGSTFDPSAAGTGNHVITYNYTDANGCSNSSTASITVHDLPAVSMSGLGSNYCDNDIPVTLTGTPAGGTFSGPGISGNTFDPVSAGTGNHTITYSYSDAFGCSNSTSSNTTVSTSPVTSITGLDTDYCEDDPTVSLNVSPAGGTLSGPGITGTSFDPSVAGTGTHSIIYYYMNAGGCDDSTIKTVSVHALPNVSISGLSSDYCADASAVTLSGSPAGGTFSGPGISGDVFDPASVSAGTHTITYTYTDAFGCSNSTTTDVTVHDNPVVTASGLASSYCMNDAAVSLSGNPAGGTFSGPGISGNTFDPVSAGTDNHQIIYVYSDSHGCTGYDTLYTTVMPLPSVSITNLPTDICINDTAITLTADPSSGTFSGTGISSNKFNPQTAGTGTHTISYTYTDANGCSNTATADITVHDLPSPAISGLNSHYCENETASLLTGSPSGGIFSGPGINSNIFDPGAAGTGNHVISYTYSDIYGCTNTTTVSTTVFPGPVATISGLSANYCENDTAVTVNVSPSGGTLSGNGISGTTFDPAAAGNGTHNLVYFYTDANGCSDSTIFSVTVHPLPALSISGLNSAYCVDGSASSLNGSPSGGTFSGPGISADSFDPAVAGAGSHAISYSYTDPQGCSNTINQNVIVHDQPAVSFSGLSAVYCENDAAVSLTGNPSGGNFSGPGTGGNTFDPALAGAGTHVISYTYSDANGCTGTDTQSVSVQSVPVVYFSGLNGPYCENEPAVTLSGTPSGGTFTGNGISGNSFDPSLAAAGTHSITYTYSDANGCSASSINDVTVNALPAVSFSGLNAQHCADSLLVNLTGTPSGGTFAGAGITGNSWSPAVAGTGNHTIRYIYTDANGCTDSTEQTVTVNPLPAVNFTGLENAYCSNDPVDSLSGTPPGGTYSGPGTSGDLFDPSAAPTGNISVNYIYTDANGCQNSHSQTTTINAAPNVSVSAASTNFCTDDAPATLNISPAGGTLSGNGISGTSFDPSVAGAGTHVITYTYTSAGGCTGTDNITMTVNTSTPITLSGIQPEYCVNDPADNIILSHPAGSVSGPGVQGTQFVPSQAGAGNHVITYTYTNASGCVSTIQENVTVYALPVVSFTGLNADYCASDAAVTLTGTPSGGTFSGAGINSNTFDPAMAGTGVHSIVYTYADTNGCSNSSSQQVQVKAVPTVTITNVQADYCINSQGDSVTVNPAGGILTGPGVSNSWFSPALAGTGTHTISYEYSGSNGCTAVDSVVITVHDLPVLTLSGLQTEYCENEPVVPVSVSPSGGTLSGPGVNGLNFNPATAGPGNHIITYSFTDTYGCSNTTSQTVTVHDIPVVSGGNDTLEVCNTDASVDLTGYGNPTPAGGKFKGPGISGNVLNPSALSPGYYNTAYFYTTPDGCTTVDSLTSLTIYVRATPVISLSGLATSYCADAAAVNLTPSPAGGSFSIAGSGAAAFTGNMFYPSKAPTGTIGVVYTISGNCVAKDTVYTDIIELPTVDAGADSSIAYGTNALLQGTAAGLPNALLAYHWTPISLVSNPYQASTPTVNLTNSQTFTLTVTDTVSGCSNMDTKEIFITGGPLAINPSADKDSICAGESTTIKANPSGGTGNYTYTWYTPGGQTLNTNQITTVDGGGSYAISVNDGVTVETDSVYIYELAKPSASISNLDAIHCYDGPVDYFNGHPAGGIMLGNGVTAGAVSFAFDPVAAGSGVHQIEYIVTNASGCTDTAYQTVEVLQNPAISISGYDTAYCSSDLPDTLFATPAGGNFYGNGVSGNVFDPMQAGAGWHMITYEYNYGGSCVASKAFSVLVKSSPIVTLSNLDSSYCVNDAAVNVTGLPAGGTLAGPGVTGMSFDPAAAGPGTHMLTYTVNSSGCPGVSYKQVIVYDIPAISFTGLNSSYCDNEAAITMTGTPVGGTYSGPGVSGNLFDPQKAGAGIHTISYTFTTGNGCTSDTSMTVSVNPSPVANAGPDLTLPCGSPGQLLGSVAQPGHTYSWTPSAGLNDTSLAQPTASPSVTTSYKLQVNNTATGCTSNDQVLVNVTGGPTASVTPKDTLICQSQPVNLTAGGGTSYQWSSGDTTASVTVYPTTDSMFVVTVTSGYCGSLDTAFIKVGNADLNMPANYTLCEDDSLNIDPGVFAFYLWSDSTANPTFTIHSGGTYWLKVTDSMGCTATDTFNVAEFPVPDVDLGADVTINRKETVQLDAGNGFEAYLWNTGSTDQIISVEGINYQAGSYPFWVMVTDQNLCSSSDTVIVNVIDASGIGNEVAGGFIRLYPNPSDGRFSLEGENIKEKLHIRIVAVNGAVIFEETLDPDKTFNRKYNMPELERGFYFLNIRTENDNKTIKFIIN